MLYTCDLVHRPILALRAGAEGLWVGLEDGLVQVRGDVVERVVARGLLAVGAAWAVWRLVRGMPAALHAPGAGDALLFPAAAQRKRAKLDANPNGKIRGRRLAGTGADGL